MSEQTDYLQQNRFLQITTKLGENALLLTEVEGTDVISTPFVYHIQFYTKEDDSKVLGLLGQPGTLLLCCGADSPGRPINGVFRKLTGPSYSGHAYKSWRAELVPQLAFLSYTADCRIFQNMTVVDIITKVLGLYQIQKFQFRNLMGTYPALDYCVQYRETALNFISRLMEHVGLYYWFEHTPDGHTLVITDSTKAAKPVSPDTLSMTDQGREAPILFLEADYSFRPGKWTLKDYDFVNPGSELLSSSPTLITQPQMTSYEVFDFPGSHGDSDMGDALARIRIEQEESQFNRYRGGSSLAAMNPGYSADISMSSGVVNLLLVEVYHHASDLTQVIPDSGAPVYGNEFSAVPLKYNFRPERIATKPFVQGPQTAKVTGPSGQSIYTDNHGRVKVRFHWDRNPDSNADDASSCWMRVSQFWTSGKSGGLQIPRVGDEVIIDFLEGDPDRPLITGRVYNGDNTHIYGQPGNLTQFGFRTQSVAAGGGAAGAGFNELRFEDAAGSEHLYIQAQKDYIRYVINDENDTIGANVTRQVAGNVGHTTTGSETKTIKQNDARNVTGTMTHQITGNVSWTHQANTSLTVGVNHDVMVGAAMSTTAPTLTTTSQTSADTGVTHNTTMSWTGTWTGFAVGAIGMSLMAYGNNTQLIASNIQIAAINTNLNLIDISTNVTKSEILVTKLQTTGVKMVTALNKISSGPLHAIQHLLELHT